MQVRDIMTKGAEYIAPTASLREAAEKMLQLDTGFLPVGDPKEDKLGGVVTDRDIVVRAIAKGLDPSNTRVTEAQSDKVLYCFEDDDLETAASSMRERQVYRLIVLNNKQDKRLSGVISLGDILRHDQQTLAEKTAKGITAHATAA